MGNITHAPNLGEHTRGIVEKCKVDDKYKVLEEKLRVVEGFNVFGADALDMWLVPNVVIPSKSKYTNLKSTMASTVQGTT